MGNSRESIALNFLPLTNQEFTFIVYRKRYGGETSEEEYAFCFRKNLPIDPLGDIDNKENRADYWISFDSLDGFEPFVCKQNYNNLLTQQYLFYVLKTRCQENFPATEYILPKKRFRRYLSFIIKEHKEGKEVVWLEPYYLSASGLFGFLIDFRFQKNHGVKFSRAVQQLSLSLDKNLRSNKNFYLDRYEKIEIFLKKYYSSLFPIHLDAKVKIDVRKALLQLPAEALKIKKYVFGNNCENNSQYNGLKQCGPLMPINRKIAFYFICRKQDIDFANQLLKALKGKTYPSTFQGMENVFNVCIDQGLIKGKSVEDFNLAAFREIIREIRNQKDTAVIPILIIPTKQDEKSNLVYYEAKYLFINEGIPLQAVTLDLLKNKDTLKWSISNIGLQIFAKLGGKPWKVKSSDDDCLIIGIGQAHKEVGDENLKAVEKYFAYSVLTESSGLYLDLEVLGKSDNQLTYIEQLKESLKQIISKYRDEMGFRKFVIHTPFKIKRFELDSIKELLSSLETQEDYNSVDFVVMKINTDNKFFGYDLEANSMVPYESTYLRISHREYLVWFEGMQYHNPNVYRRFSGPTHIEFYYQNRVLEESERMKYLQDTINLSGANWRGFNAKSLPVSILYCKLVANFIKEFNGLGRTDYHIDNLKPWFL